MPVQGIPCLEMWLFHKEKSQLAEKCHQQPRNRRGLLIKLGEFCVFCHHLLVCTHRDMRVHYDDCYVGLTKPVWGCLESLEWNSGMEC